MARNAVSSQRKQHPYSGLSALDGREGGGMATWGSHPRLLWYAALLLRGNETAA